MTDGALIIASGSVMTVFTSIVAFIATRSGSKDTGEIAFRNSILVLLEANRDELEKYKEQANKLQKELESLRSIYRDLQDTYRVAERSNDALSRQVELLNASLATYNNGVTQTTATCTSTHIPKKE